MFAVLIGYLGFRTHVLGGVAPYETTTTSLFAVTLTVPRLFALYVQKLVAPVGLNVVYDLEPVGSVASPVFVLAVAVIAAFAVASWLVCRANRTATFGVALFVLALAPALYVPALSQDVSKAFAERARYNLAVAFEQLGWKGSAIQEYQATVSRAPGHADAHNNLGVLLAQVGRVDEAIEHFQAAVRARPRDVDSHLNLAHAFDMKGMTRQADEQRALATLAEVTRAR